MAALEAGEETCGPILDDEEIEENIARSLAAPPPSVIRICEPWEDDLRAA